MASEGILSISVASVVEDVLKQHGSRLSDIDLASRKAEEAGWFISIFFSRFLEKKVVLDDLVNIFYNALYCCKICYLFMSG